MFEVTDNSTESVAAVVGESASRELSGLESGTYRPVIRGLDQPLLRRVTVTLELLGGGEPGGQR
ncbi:MAG: hypothetical protein H6741_26835 [Alphaproteobacteria bacterium]|nr:hypothetical protein [Alphaproteobacteria bacterium]